MTRGTWQSLSDAYRTGVAGAVSALWVIFAIDIVAARPYHIEPVAETVMDATPVVLAVPLLRLLGPFAKPLALWGAIALVLVLGGLAGVLLSRCYGVVVSRPSWQRSAIVGSIAAVFVLEALVLLRAGVVIGIAAGVYVVVVSLLNRSRCRPPGDARRTLLKQLGLTVATFGVATFAFGDALRRGKQAERVRAAPFVEAQVGQPDPPPWDTPGLSALVTPTSRFYTMSKNVADPVIPPDAWGLDIFGGEHRSFVRLTPADILALPRVHQYVTLECISNAVGGPLMGNAMWTGVQLQHLLDLVGVSAGTRRVIVRAEDGEDDSLPLEDARHPLVLLAYGMGGEWLRPEHGYPLRLLVPGWYGFKSVKWLRSMTLSPDDYQGHWQRRNWVDRAIIHPVARIDFAQESATGLLTGGVALTGGRGVSAVDVRANGGAWQAATLRVPPLGEATWVQWMATLAVRGEVLVEARVIDGAGQPQTAVTQGQFPSGATGYHTVRVTVG